VDIVDLPKILYKNVSIKPGEVDEKTWLPELHREGKWMRDKLRDQERSIKAILNSGMSDQEIIKSLEGMVNGYSLLRRWFGLAKIDSAVEYIKEDLKGGQKKIVIFASNKCVVNALRFHLRDMGAVTLFGGSSSLKKKKNLSNFLNKDKCRVFIGHASASGSIVDGLESVARNIIFIEPSWISSENAQSIMRVHRHGQKKTVLVRFLSMENTIDENICITFMRNARLLTETY
jgi:DNA repair protein RAD5